MKELTKKGIAFATALAISSLGFVGIASAESPVLDPSDPDEKTLILTAQPGVNNKLIINKTVEAPEGTDVSGLTFEFDFQPVTTAILDGNGDTEVGWHAVPNATADMATADVNQMVNQPIDVQTVYLTAGTQNADRQSLSDNITLPDPNFFGNAGVYVYEVEEGVGNYAAGDSIDNWDNDAAKYRLRLYVKNGTEITGYTDGTYTITPAVYAELPAAQQEFYEAVTRNVLVYDKATIEKIHEGVYGGDEADCNVKVASMDFVNTYKALSDLTITKTVSGDYANRAKAFNFTTEIMLPDYFDGQTITVGINGQSTTLNVATIGGKKVITIPTYNLAADESTHITGLPVGSIYRVIETDPTDGVNNYEPSAQYVYKGAANAASGFGDNTNTVDAGTAGSAYHVYAATAQTQNAKTAIGAGSGNAVTVTNVLDNPPSPTGVLVENLPFALVLAIPAVLGGIAIASRKREGEEA